MTDTPARKSINAAAFKAYDPARWTLIPLFHYWATSKKHGHVRKDGKRPIDAHWTTANYQTPKVLERCIKENRNAGVRLTATQLVIDVDPRNGGDEGFDNLCLDLGIDPLMFPRVITGSGGSHYYTSKPGDVPVLDTLEAYPGVEFKSKGRQVLAAGCVHPETEKPYAFDPAHPLLQKAPPIPRVLLDMIRRPQRSAITGGGDWSQADVAKALDALNPEAFREHDKWLRLMMACHHASAGDARSEFVEWSTRDPQYANDAELIGRRWDSLHAEKMDGVTSATLKYILAENGAANAMKAADVKGDFDAEPIQEEPSEEDEEDPLYCPPAPKSKKEDILDDGTAEETLGGMSEESINALMKLNETYCSVVEGSKFRVVFKQFDPVLHRDFWVRMAPADFMTLHSNQRIIRDKEGLSKNAADTLPLGKAWIEWPNRKHVKSILFDPQHEHEGHLNLWTGFAYEPSPKGEWSRLDEMIFEVLANGEEPIYQYILNWMRYMVQKPWKPAEIALVFRGGMGVGKGTLGNICARLIGRHAIAISSPEMITGRFNSHLQDVVFLFADEAIKPYDKSAESRLKAFITEPLLAFEGKGRDAIVGHNYLHIMMASNEGWVIPAGMDERRFLMSDANTKWQRKFDLWKALHAQMEADGDSGYRRLLFDLLRVELPHGWRPATHLPITNALIDQKIRSMSPLRQFLFNCVTFQALPFETLRGPWDKARVRCFAEDFRDAFQTWCRENGMSAGAMGRSNMRFLMQEMKLVFPNAHTNLREPIGDRVGELLASPSDGRAQALELPPLEECRSDFERQLGGPVSWHGEEALDFG